MRVCAYLLMWTVSIDVCAHISVYVCTCYLRGPRINAQKEYVRSVRITRSYVPKQTHTHTYVRMYLMFVSQ
jgi:hypothetical protein